MNILNNYILDLQAKGRLFFSKKDVITDLKLSQGQFRFQAYRLSKKGLIKKLTNDFFMIISPEYRNFGSLPSNWIIDSLMKHLNQEYYIGLLSAASLYGATEQQPMVFQVITNKLTKNIKLNRDKIEFHVYKYCSLADKALLTLPTGYTQISSKEQTIVDLVRFYPVSGYLSNVASIIKILANECDPINLSKVIKNEKINPILQRLGYILEINKFFKLSKIIENELSKRKFKYVFLRPDFHNKTGDKNKTWKLILNDTLEIE